MGLRDSRAARLQTGVTFKPRLALRDSEGDVDSETLLLVSCGYCDRRRHGVLWNLEGGAPSGLIRDGWTSKTLKPGDELQLSVDPLRSGAPGGAWNVNKIKYKDGNPIVAKP